MWNFMKRTKILTRVWFEYNTAIFPSLPSCLVMASHWNWKPVSRHACLNDTTILKSPLHPPKSILSSSTVLHTSWIQAGLFVSRDAVTNRRPSVRFLATHTTRDWFVEWINKVVLLRETRLDEKARGRINAATNGMHEADRGYRERGCYDERGRTVNWNREIDR